MKEELIAECQLNINNLSKLLSNMQTDNSESHLDAFIRGQLSAYKKILIKLTQ